MSLKKNNSTKIDHETGFGFGSGIVFGIAMGLVGYFMVSSGKGKQLASYISDLASQPDLDNSIPASAKKNSSLSPKDETKVEDINSVAQVKSMLSQLSSRFEKLSEKQKKNPYTNS